RFGGVTLDLSPLNHTCSCSVDRPHHSDVYLSSTTATLNKLHHDLQHRPVRAFPASTVPPSVSMVIDDSSIFDGLMEEDEKDKAKRGEAESAE
ncbi:hypothetical protein JZ751_016632, partial [Albula glossodonta]